MKIELALREAKARFSNAISNAPFPLMIHASDGKVEQINTAWEELTGYTQAEIPTIADWTQKAYGQKKELCLILNTRLKYYMIVQKTTYWCASRDALLGIQP